MIFSRQAKILFFMISCAAFVSCAGEKKAKSVAQIYKEEGYPVKTRDVEEETFSLFLKYPAVYKSMSQSTAYSKLQDIVRRVNFRVGERVKKDDVVMSLSTDNASYKSAKVQLDNANASFKRIESLYKDNGVSRQEFENARTQLEVAREEFRQLSEMIEIKAPISGTITQMNVNVNSDVHEGSPLFTVSNQDGYEAHFFVLADEIEMIHTGENAEIETKDGKIKGTVNEVSMTIDAEALAFPVKAYFSQKDKSLASGMSVDVSVEVYRNNHAVVVTQNEMTRSGDDWSAFVMTADGKCEKRALTLGRRQGISYEVLSGLKAGEKLITEGFQRLSGGEKVVVEKQER